MGKKTEAGKISYIAQAQLIGCLLVILGHSIPLNWDIPHFMYRMDVFLYTFHMPLFFFISGYLFEKTGSSRKYSFCSYLRKRTKRLMLPYVVLTVIGLVVNYLMDSFTGNLDAYSLSYVIESFLVPRQNVWGHFWFLPTLLLISMFAFPFSRLKSIVKGKVLVMFTVMLFVMTIIPKLTDLTGWFAINDVIKFTCYYALGVAHANSKIEEVCVNKKINKLLLLLMPVSVGLFLIKIENDIIRNMVREIIGILMIYFILVLAQLFDITNTKFGNFLTKKTYSIFILSWPFQSIVSLVFEKKLGLEYYITMPIAFVVGVIGPIIVIIAVDLIEKKIGKKIISPIIGG